MIELLIFDADGTLIEVCHVDRRAAAELVRGWLACGAPRVQVVYRDN